MAGVPDPFGRRSATKAQRPDLSPCRLRRKLPPRFLVFGLREADSLAPAHLACGSLWPSGPERPRSPVLVNFC